jgi:hypothetical protein
MMNQWAGHGLELHGMVVAFLADATGSCTLETIILEREDRLRVNGDTTTTSQSQHIILTHAARHKQIVVVRISQSWSQFVVIINAIAGTALTDSFSCESCPKPIAKFS